MKVLSLHNMASSEVSPLLSEVSEKDERLLHADKAVPRDRHGSRWIIVQRAVYCVAAMVVSLMMFVDVRGQKNMQLFEKSAKHISLDRPSTAVQQSIGQWGSARSGKGKESNHGGGESGSADFMPKLIVFSLDKTLISELMLHFDSCPIKKVRGSLGKGLKGIVELQDPSPCLYLAWSFGNSTDAFQ
jgi:hypothetical protein